MLVRACTELLIPFSLPLVRPVPKYDRETKHLQISEVRSGTHNNGGRNPDWTRRNNFFTFYVPSNVPLSQLAVVLEVYDSNSMSADKMIGTCGKIPLNGVSRANASNSEVIWGSPRYQPVRTG